MKTFEPRTLERWRQWLASHHASESEVWLVFRKRHTGKPSISYEHAVDEALCHGWVDSLIKRIDDERYARKFTPRKPDSAWSTINRVRYAALKAAGRLTPAGLARAPGNRSGDAPRVRTMPPYIEHRIRQHPRAWKFFESLAPSYRRRYINWVDSAKQEETRIRRLGQAIEKLEREHKPVM